MRHDTTDTTTTTTTDDLAVFSDDDRDDLRRRWEEIETRFVDDPAGATESADDLVGDAMDRITTRWHDHRSELRDRWSDDDTSTEELRTTLKRYRASLESLLSR